MPLTPKIEIVRDLTAWDTLDEEWNALFAASPTAAPPLRLEWLQLWWNLYGVEYAAQNGTDTGLRLFLVRRGRQLIGALPLYVRRSKSVLHPRRLGFIGTGEDEEEELCSEHLNLLHLPGEGDVCLAALLPALMRPDAAGWDEIHLGPLPMTSPLAVWRGDTDSSGSDSASVSQSSQSSPSVLSSFQSTDGGPCFVADLTGGFEAYMQRISKNSRQLARKRLNGAERAGAKLEVAADVPSALEMLAQVAELHQARWEAVGKPGCFASPRFAAFHRAMLTQGVGQQTAVVARLVCQGETVAAMLGYIANGKFDSYAAGAKLNDDEPVMSPGIVLHLLLKQHLCERGITHYDHLSGAMRYKQQYTTEEQPSFTLSRTRPSLRAAAGRASDLFHKVGRKGLELARSATSKETV